jgi:hypothetical protein
MHEFQRTELQEAVNARMRVIRGWIPQAMQAAQQEVPGIPLRARDGHSACQYISIMLWRFGDPERVQVEPDAALYDVLIEKTVDAALYRLRERQKALERLEL